MVQSIWLKFDNKNLDKDKMRKIIKRNYKTYSCVNPPHKSFINKFVFLNYLQIKNILNKINLKVDDKKQCNCGCCSTDFERLCYFIDLEFCSRGLGRDVWGSVGMYTERLSVLYFILKHLQSEFKKEGIVSRMDLSDCDKNLIKGLKK